MDVTTLSNESLITLRIEVEREMKARGISYSVGEIGENVAIRHFASTPGLPNLTLAPHCAKNVDALSRDGNRYSIKTVLHGKKTGTVYPDDYDPNKQLFEFLLIVKLAPDFTLESIHRFSWSQFLQIRAWDKRMNAWYVPISKNRLGIGECLYSKA